MNSAFVVHDFCFGTVLSFDMFVLNCDSMIWIQLLILYCNVLLYLSLKTSQNSENMVAVKDSLFCKDINLIANVQKPLKALILFFVLWF